MSHQRRPPSPPRHAPVTAARKTKASNCGSCSNAALTRATRWSFVGGVTLNGISAGGVALLATFLAIRSQAMAWLSDLHLCCRAGGIRTRDLLTPSRYTADSPRRTVPHHVAPSQVTCDAVRPSATAATPRHSKILDEFLDHRAARTARTTLRSSLSRGHLASHVAGRSQENGAAQCRRANRRDVGSKLRQRKSFCGISRNALVRRPPGGQVTSAERSIGPKWGRPHRTEAPATFDPTPANESPVQPSSRLRTQRLESNIASLHETQGDSVGVRAYRGAHDRRLRHVSPATTTESARQRAHRRGRSMLRERRVDRHQGAQAAPINPSGRPTE